MNKVVQIFLGAVFLSAALFRICNYPAAKLEVGNLGLPDWTSALVIILELAIAASFLTNAFVKHASLMALVFLAAPICLGVFLYWQELYSQLPNLFVFNASATDILLHMVFLTLLVLIYITERAKGNRE